MYPLKYVLIQYRSLLSLQCTKEHLIFRRFSLTIFIYSYDESVAYRRQNDRCSPLLKAGKYIQGNINREPLQNLTLNNNLLMQREETGCSYVVCRIIPLLMTILEIHPSSVAELRTVGEKYLSLEDQQLFYAYFNVETLIGCR